MGLDIGKAFTFVTDDPKWVTKVLIGGGLDYRYVGPASSPLLAGSSSRRSLPVIRSSWRAT